MLEGIDQANV